jgi:glycerophosphoryl diester phosphodiesterase
MRPLVCFIAISLTGCLNLESDRLPKKNPEFLVIGHRGAPNVQAENTIASLDTALTLGANAVEIDLCVTLDGQVVLWHDRDPGETVAIARQEGFEGLAWNPYVPFSGDPFRLPIDQLAYADFVGTHGYVKVGETERDPNAPIATLAQALAWAKRASGLRAIFLDIKVAPGRADQATLLFRAVAQASLPRSIQVYLMSQAKDIVQVLIAERDAAGSDADNLHPIWEFESEGAVDGARELGLRHVSTGLTLVRSESDFLGEIQKAVEARQANEIDSVIVWTFDSPMQMGTLLFHQVDGVMTNDAAKLYDIWQLTL